jgi:hypothetical protein
MPFYTEARFYLRSQIPFPPSLGTRAQAGGDATVLAHVPRRPGKCATSAREFADDSRPPITALDI